MIFSCDKKLKKWVHWSVRAFVRIAFLKYALQVKMQSRYVKGNQLGSSRVNLKIVGLRGTKGVKWGQVRLSRVRLSLVGEKFGI